VRADIERWDRKYTRGNPNPAFTPDALLLTHRALLDGRGLALDLACGVGHNALFLARLGYEVLAVDGSLRGLAYARDALRREHLQVHLVAADLQRLALPRGRFDVIVVIRYLERTLLPAIKEAVRPGGLLLYKTFNLNHARERPDFSRAYLLAPGELRELLADFECIDANDDSPPHESLSWCIARRPRR
jgi:tellurite methyltransferase